MASSSRQGNREFYYQQLDNNFAGLKQQYIRQYGYSYWLPSPHSERLMNILKNFCLKHKMMYQENEIFRYCSEFDIKHEQLSLFE